MIQRPCGLACLLNLRRVKAAVGQQVEGAQSHQQRITSIQLLTDEGNWH
jgi:hypothetical protein